MMKLHTPIDTMRRLKNLLLTFFAVFLCPALLAGQDNQQGNQQSLLPEIDPQDIEIRSEFKARFPGLRRQPILGFETTMQVYQIDPDRKPFMETREEIVANLPISDLTRPSAPEYQFPPFAPSIQAYGEAGVGSYLSPEARFWGNYDISSRSSVGATLDYHSSDGHLDTRVSSFRFLNLDAEFATDLNAQSKLTVGAGLQSDFNRLFDPGLDPVFGVDLPLGSEKRYDGYNVQASFRQFRNTVEGWSADARFRSYEVTMNAGDLSGEIMESTYGGSIQKQWPGNNIQETFAARVKLRGGRYETDNLIEETWYTVSGGARYQRLFNYSTQLTAAFDLYAVSNLFEDKIHPAPSIEVKHWLSDNLVLSGQAKAQPQLVAHEKLHHLNRFLNTENQLRHTYQIDAEARVSFEYYRGSRVEVGLSYMNAENYLYFNRELAPVTIPILPGSQEPLAYYGINYSDATRLKAFASISHQLVPEKFWIDGKIYLQQPELDNGAEIPFEEEWGINSGISFKAFQKLTVKGWADYVGSRPTLTDAGRLDGFLLLGGEIRVEITEKIGAYAKFINLLDEEYQIWQGYPERPLQAYGGVTFKL